MTDLAFITGWTLLWGPPAVWLWRKSREMGRRDAREGRR